jgi:glutathione reductase (NADPH)
MTFDCDLFVIGGGSGGVRAARMAAATGARVELAEESRMGGTCVIRGCVPKKLMVFASSFREMPAEARAYGWSIPDGTFDWGAFRSSLDAELDRLEGVYRRLLAGSGVTVHDQRARVADPHEVELADGRRISAKHILIAAGGRPERPDLPGAEVGLVSDDIFRMERLPASMLIVGGGFIACEMACILQGLGVQVTQFYRGAQILRGFDSEARGMVAEAMCGRGIDLHLGTTIETIGLPDQIAAGRGLPVEELRAAPVALLPASGPVAVRTVTGRNCQADAILFATGRRPNTAGLGLAEIGVKLGRKGEVLVDSYSQTAVPSIYAMGDVTDRVNLTPVAIREGMPLPAPCSSGVPTPGTIRSHRQRRLHPARTGQHRPDRGRCARSRARSRSMPPASGR